MEKHYHALIPGQIFFGAAADIQQIADEEGIALVVDLREESTGCATTNPHVHWVQVPLGDHADKVETELFQKAIQTVVAAYRSGKKVAFHCGGGKGRTGAVATGVLLELGMATTVAQAEEKARQIRSIISIKPNQRLALEQLYENTSSKESPMKSIQVFDPALCCSTGVCGVETDQALISFAADVEWAQQSGAKIERVNLAQNPMAFATNAVVKAFLERSGPEALPLVLVEGEVALAGRYPTRAELTRWLGIAHPEAAPASSCCAPGKCC